MTAKKTTKSVKSKKSIVKTTDPRVAPAPGPTVAKPLPESPECPPDADCDACEAMTDPAPAPCDETTPRDHDTVADELCAEIHHLGQIEAEKACAMKAYSKQISGVQGAISRLADELEEIDCEVVYNYIEGTATKQNKRTGRVIWSRPLADEDRQGELPFDATDKLDTGEDSEAAAKAEPEGD